MTTFEAKADGIEVNGTTIQSVVAGMGILKTLAKRLLKEEGIDLVPDENHWYSQQAWLNTFKRLAKEAGDITLSKIGASIPEHAKFPPNIQTITDALMSIDVAYHMNHRDASGKVLFDGVNLLPGIGNYKFRSTGANSAEIICDTPYPCAFDEGIVTAMAKRFEPGAKVTHKDGSCRKTGDSTCTYEVSW